MSRLLSCILPNSGPSVQRLGLAEMARAAEAAGADGLWVSDHLLMVDRPVSGYPYSADGAITWDIDTDYFEALTVLAYLAAVTERCRLGTAVLILPQRNVLQFAKEVATIDRLSAGRIELGVGAGWYRDEMTALGWDFETRGARMDEMLGVLRNAWSGRTEPFDGAELQVEEGLVFQPTPIGQGGPPIHVGGVSRAAIRRAARSGDGWLAIAYAETWERSVFDDHIARLSRDVAAAGRIGLPKLILKLHRESGTDAARMAAVTRAAYDAGFDEVIVELPWGEGIAAAVDDFESIAGVVRSV